jgi:hypothetical protein
MSEADLGRVYPRLQVSERDQQDRPSDEAPAEEGQGASREDADEQAGVPEGEGQGEEGQASGNPKSAG